MIDSNSKILVVDDFKLIRTMIKKSLGDMKITNITEATDGVEAQELLAKALEEGQPYNLMFLDWNMPRKTGMELLQECRNDRRFDPLAIIMVTAESEQKSIVAAIKTGATDYVIKPISADIIKDKIKALNDLLATGKTA